MENLLLNSAKSFFNEESLNLLSSNTGESPDTVKKGMDAIIPAVMLGLQGQGQSGLTSILDKAKQHFNFSDFNFNSFFDNNPDQPAGDSSKDLLGSIFGTGLTGIVSSLAGFLNLKSDSITKLLSVSLPAVFSSLTDKGTNWNASSISNLLDSNKDSLMAAVPSGLGLASLGGLASAAKDFISEKTAVPAPPKIVKEEPVPVHTNLVVEKEKKGAGLWWLLIPLLLIAGWLLFGKGCGSQDSAVVLSDSSLHTDLGTMHDSSTLTTATRETVNLKLPNGQDLSAFTGGIEDQLIQFLQAGDYKNLSDEALKAKWFDFDNLNFETGTANILPESRAQLVNIAAILKVFPDVKIKIGGYTDKTGNEEINEKISSERAAAVKGFLAEQGLGDQVSDTEGYGSEFAKYEASAPESDRVKDRRVSISIRK